MRVKNLILGNISLIEPVRIPMEDYYPSAFDEIVNGPTTHEPSLFYKLGNTAIDLIHLGCYKLVKKQENYPDELVNRKVVIFEQPFSDLTVRHDISRNDAVLVYKNRRIK